MAQRPAIAIVTNNPAEVFQRDVIVGAEAVLLEHGYNTTIITVPEPVANLDGLSDIADAAGVLVIANCVPDNVLHDLYATGVPLSLVSHRVPHTPIPAVIPDNLDGIASLMHYIIVHCGRHKPAFIRGDMAQNDGIMRDRAFRQALMRHNIDIPDSHILRGDFIPSVAADSLREFLAHEPDFDVLIVSDYLMAAAALDVLREHGIAVPAAVSVVGFGDGPEAAKAGITTVAADVVVLGRRAARQLIGQMQGLTINGFTVLSTELVERETCKAIPQ